MYLHPTIARLLLAGREEDLRRHVAERSAIRAVEAARSTPASSATLVGGATPVSAAKPVSAAVQPDCAESAAAHRGVTARRPA